MSSYSYLGIDFSSTEDWDMHIRKVYRRKVNQLHKVISNRNISLSSYIHRLLLLSVIRSSIYGVWK